jgi:hypothetical protein
MAETILLVASVVILVVTTFVLLRRTRDREWVRDAHLTMNATCRTSVVMLVLQALGAAGGLALGALFIALGHAAVGWGLSCIALMFAVVVCVQFWVLRQPLTDD